MVDYEDKQIDYKQEGKEHDEDEDAFSGNFPPEKQCENDHSGQQ